MCHGAYTSEASKNVGYEVTVDGTVVGEVEGCVVGPGLGSVVGTLLGAQIKIKWHQK